MNANKFSDAMGELGEKYIIEAAVYQGKRTRRIFVKWASFAACLMVVAMVFGIIPLLNNQPASPFVITAYAMDGEVVGYEMTEGECVPISMFQMSGGLKGFVFSQENPNKGQTASISIISNGNYGERIEEIVGIATDPAQNYLVYIPGEAEQQPYSMFVTNLDAEENKVYEFAVSISQEGETYYAELVSQTVRDAVYKQD